MIRFPRRFQLRTGAAATRYREDLTLGLTRAQAILVRQSQVIARQLRRELAAPDVPFTHVTRVGD